MQASFTSRTMGTGLAYRLDARTKMGISLLGSAAVMILSRPAPLGLLLIASLAYAATLNRPRALLICHGCIIGMWVVAYGFMHLLQLIGPGSASADLARLLVPFLRSAVMVNVILVMALSTRIQTVLTTLKTLRLHRCIAIPAAVMVRFIPAFMADIRQVSETLKTRGYTMAPLFVLRHPLLASRLLFVPLVFRALRASDELGIAAELKGLGYGGQICACRPPRFSGWDAAASVAALTCVAGGIVLQNMGGWSGGGMF